MLNEKREEIQQDALQEIGMHVRCTASISMRVGKCYIGLQRLDRLYKLNNGNLKALIAAPKKSIFKSWEEDAIKFNLTHLLPHITFTTYLSLPKESLDYDIVILDEVHSLTGSHIVFLRKYSGMILGLTGTPPKNKGSLKAKMIDTFCPIVYEYVTNNAVDDKILNDYRIIVHLLNISDEKTMKVKTKAGGVFYTSEKKSYDYWSEKIEGANSMKEKQLASVMRMKAMQDFPSKVEYARNLLTTIDDKCLVFVNTHEQADSLSAHSYHSKNKESKKNLELFKLGHVGQLTCVAQLSEGITIEELNTVVVLHSYSNEKALSQRIARALSLKPDEVATMHILAYKDTCDANVWVPSSLEDFDQSKIRYVEFN